MLPTRLWAGFEPAGRVPRHRPFQERQVEAVEAELLELLAPVAPRSGRIPFYSALEGRSIDTARLDAGYWYANVRETVRFADAVRALAGQGYGAFIEVSPHPVLEAEAVALLCCESLGLEGAEFSRGYIQSWGQGQTFTERSAQRIFHAADRILKAGYAQNSTTEAIGTLPLRAADIGNSMALMWPGYFDWSLLLSWA